LSFPKANEAGNGHRDLEETNNHETTNNLAKIGPDSPLRSSNPKPE